MSNAISIPATTKSAAASAEIFRRAIRLTPEDLAADAEFRRYALAVPAGRSYSRELLEWEKRDIVIAAVALVREQEEARKRAHLTDAVVGVAARIAETREWGLLPILADALQEAGIDAAALKIIRNPGWLPGWPLEIQSDECAKLITTLRTLLLDNVAEVIQSARSQERALAVKLAERYHATVRSLYTSSRASVGYGSTPESQTDWKAYSKSYGYPANWTDAAACIVRDHTDGSRWVRITTSRGTHVATLPLPPANASFEGSGLFTVDGKVYRAGKTRGSSIHNRYEIA